MANWRVQYREYRTNLKTPAPGEIKHEDGHSRDTAITRAVEILNTQDICWLILEDLDAPHPGNSSSRPKPRKGKG